MCSSHFKMFSGKIMMPMAKVSFSSVLMST